MSGSWGPFATAVFETYDLNSVEEIERDLGIDIVTLFRALRKGIYDFVNKTHYEVSLRESGMSRNWELIIEPSFCLQYEPPWDPDLGVYTHEYGKTWVVFGEQGETK